MSEVTTKQLREQLSRYLAGDLEPAAFRDWFAPVLRDAQKSSDPQVEELAHSIEWTLWDLECGALPEEILKQNLLRLAAPDTFLTGKAMTTGDMVYGWTTGASATLRGTSAAFASQAWMQISREKEYA
jgi:hypothetical protein